MKDKVKFGTNVLVGKNVKIGSNCLIGHNSIIETNVSIGDNCTIDHNSMIGSNVSIGNNSKIFNCTIEDSIVMNNCLINTKTSIIDSIIAQISHILSESSTPEKKKFLLGEGTKISL